MQRTLCSKLASDLVTLFTPSITIQPPDPSLCRSSLNPVYMESMEASFRSRIDRTFGFLNDSNNKGDTHLWSVEERAAFKKNKGLSRGAGEGDSDDDESSGYTDFLKSETTKQRDNQGERLIASFFGEEDLEELESGDADDEDDEDDEEEDDMEEVMRIGKRKKGEGQQTEIKLLNVANEERGEEGALKLPNHEEEVDDEDEEVREVREMVGMDDTLDFEDEEDEYDKLAVGAEGSDDRLFMSRVRNFGASRQQLNPLPTSLVEMRHASRDRRANHEAALARLQEDDLEAATKAVTESLQATEGFITEKSDRSEDPNMFTNLPVRQDNGGEAMDIDGDGQQEEPLIDAKDGNEQSLAGNLESCRVSEGKQRKPGKRVRFSIDEPAGAQSNAGRSDERAPIATPSLSLEDMPSTAITTVPARNRYSKVPDYVKNPSKYIHYTLDWSEEDGEQENLAAFQAARTVSSSRQNVVTDKKEEAVLESQGPPESTKISFNPLVTLAKRSSKDSGRGERKDSGKMHIDVSEGVVTNGVVNVAANFDVDINLGGVITMEDDQDLSTSSDLVGQQKSGRVVRRYRNRVTDDFETE